MLAALIIVFREVVEAGLIVGVVLAATEGVPSRGRWIACGVASGLAGAAVIALAAGRISQAMNGSGQDLFQAALLITATLMLGWHALWMSRHGRDFSLKLRAVGSKVARGDLTLAAMAAVVAIALLREGVEVALFLFGVAASGGEQPVSMLTGGLLGLAAGALLSWLLYRGLIAIPARRLFAVTNAMLALVAAGMAGQAAVYLVNAGLIPPLGTQLWDSSAILRDDSLIGRALHGLAGYSDRPMGVQMLVYAVVLAALVLGTPRANQPR